MNIPKNNDRTINQNGISNPIDAIISKIADHPSILNTNKTIKKIYLSLQIK